jgi:hypothetical protein
MECGDCGRSFRGRRALTVHVTDVHAAKVECR